LSWHLHRCLIFICGTSYLMFNNLCGWYTRIKWPTSHFLLENVMNSWGPNNVELWLTEQILASPLSFTERPNVASIWKWDLKNINFTVECNKNQYFIHSMPLCKTFGCICSNWAYWLPASSIHLKMLCSFIRFQENVC